MSDKQAADAKVERQYKAFLQTQMENDEKSFNIVRDLTSDDGRGVWGSEANAIIDTRQLKSLFYNENWVFIVVDLIAMKICNQPMYVYRKEMVGGKNNYIIAENHPTQKKLDNPNKFQDYASFMYCLVADLICTGNSIVWKGVSNQQMFLFGPEEMQIDFNKMGEITTYNKVSGSSDNLQITGRFPPDKIIHPKRPNPSSLFWGLSPFVPGRKSILFNRYSQEYLNSYYQKGALPGLALEINQDANEGLAIRLLRSFEQAFTGRTNQRRTLLLPKGVTSKQISTTLADQQLKDYLLVCKEDILALLKVPKHEVGMQTAGSLGSEEYKTALKNFWATTILPTMGHISGEFTRGLADELGENHIIQFFVEDVDILQEDKLTKANLATALKQTHSVNEIRKELYEMEPIEGGDVLQGIQQQQPYFNLSLPSSETKENKENGQPIIAPAFNSADTMIKAHGDWFDQRKQDIEQGTKDAVKEMNSFALKIFGDQSISIIKQLDKILKKNKAKTPDDEVTPFEKLAKDIIKNELFGYAIEWRDEYKNIFHAVSVLGYVLGNNPPIIPKEELPEITDKIKKELDKDLTERSKRTFEFMNEKTTNDAYAIIKRGMDKSETSQQIAVKLSELYTDQDKIMYRANRIARTETLSALSIGQNRSMKNAAKIIPDLKKMWVSTEDNRTRGNPNGLYKDSTCDHWGLHGQVVSHDEKFIEPRTNENLEFPRDPNGSASNVINCRCTWIVLPAKDMSKFQKQESEAQPHE